jgi:hypothetical protein
MQKLYFGRKIYLQLLYHAASAVNPPWLKRDMFRFASIAIVDRRLRSAGGAPLRRRRVRAARAPVFPFVKPKLNATHARGAGRPKPNNNARRRLAQDDSSRSH